MGKKHKSPSRITYEENNPNWTVRMPKEWHVVTEVFLKESNLSRRGFMGVALKIQKMDYEMVRTEGYNDGFSDGEVSGYEVGSSEGYNKGWQQGHNDGQKKGNEEGYQTGYAEGLKRGKKEGYDEGAEYIYEKTKDQNKLWHYCAVCGEPIFIEPNSPAHHFIIDMMRFNGWKHQGCAPRGNPFW